MSRVFVASLLLTLLTVTPEGHVHAQAASPNACLAILRRSQLPTTALEAAAVPADLSSACAAYQRMAPWTAPGDDPDVEALRARLSEHSGLVMPLTRVGREGCVERCALLRIVVLGLVLERFAHELRAMTDTISDESDTPAVRGSMLRPVLDTLTRAQEAYDATIAAANTPDLSQLRAALVPHRVAVVTALASLRREVEPVLADTTCPAITERRTQPRPAPRQTSRLLLVHATNVIAAPLADDEHARVTDAVREALSRLPNVEVVAKADVDAIVREARAGRALGRATCAAPLSFEDAIEDARPDAVRAQVHLACTDGDCAIHVSFHATGVAPEEDLVAMRAEVRQTPERERAWLAAARSLEPVRDRRLGTMYMIAGAEPTVSAVQTFGRGLDAASLRAALTNALPALAACARPTGRGFDAVLDVEPSGRVTLVRRSDAELTSAACTTDVLAQLALPRGSGTRRAVIGVTLRGGFSPPSATERRNTPSSPHGVHFSELVRSDERLDIVEGRRATERAVATCDSERATRSAPLTVNVALSLDGAGAVTRVVVMSENASVSRCMERELARFATTCPRNRTAGEISARLCSFPP